MKTGAPAGDSDHQDPTYAHISGINTVTAADNRKHKGPSAGERANYGTFVQWKTTQQERGGPTAPSLLPPAGTRQRSPTSGRGPDSGIRHSASISRPSGEGQTRGLENRLEAAWGSETGTVGVMRCSLECGVMALSTLVKRCRSVH